MIPIIIFVNQEPITRHAGCRRRSIVSRCTTLPRKTSLNFVCFASYTYVSAWIACQVTCDAPINDFQLYKKLVEYPAVNGLVADVAIKKFANHLWCVGAELFPLTLFSHKEHCEVKDKIAANMRQTGVHEASKLTIRMTLVPKN